MHATSVICLKFVVVQHNLKLALDKALTALFKCHPYRNRF